MYANLHVRVTRQDGSHDEHFAWQVDVGPTGTTIHVDRQDGSGSYAVEGGKLKVAGAKAIEIRADF